MKTKQTYAERLGEAQTWYSEAKRTALCRQCGENRPSMVVGPRRDGRKGHPLKLVGPDIPALVAWLAETGFLCRSCHTHQPHPIISIIRETALGAGKPTIGDDDDDGAGTCNPQEKGGVLPSIDPKIGEKKPRQMPPSERRVDGGCGTIDRKAMKKRKNELTRLLNSIQGPRDLKPANYADFFEAEEKKMRRECGDEAWEKEGEPDSKEEGWRQRLIRERFWMEPVLWRKWTAELKHIEEELGSDPKEPHISLDTLFAREYNDLE